MNAACREIEHRLETFVDGELAMEQTLAVEGHLGECARCSEHVALLETMRMGTRQAAYEQAPVTAAFEERVRAALAAEREQARPVPSPSLWLERVRHGAARGVVPIAVAAVIVLWLQNRGEAPANKAAKVAAIDEAAMGIDQALDRLIDYHSAPPPAQVTSADELPLFDRDVGVRVHAPALDKFGAQWEGASLVSVRNHQAASLRYRMPGRRFTVYVYDPRKVTVNGSLPRRIVHNAPLYVGEWRGYTVAAKEQRGIGYAMASDLDDATTAELITEIH
jgi:anti-sigma factor RsiW